MRTSDIARSGRRVRALRWSLLVLVGAASAVGTVAGLGHARPASADGESAAGFAATTVRMIADNRYGAVWRSLHAAHQRAVGNRSTYVRCELATPIPGRVHSIRVLGRRPEKTVIPALGSTDTEAVTLRIVFEQTGVTVDHVVHVVRSDGGWRWVLPRARYETYAAHRCP
jgi:hypothetical protein